MNLNDTTSTAPIGSTSYLVRPEGRIGYDVAGAGPLLVLVPGMGDLRAGYRFLASALRAAGYRVACTDLRGHGDSDTTFPAYGDEETAGDIVALIAELGPAVVVGNSMAAGSAVIAATAMVNQLRRQYQDLVILPAHDPGAAARLAQATASVTQPHVTQHLPRGNPR
jgi:pimeloyl-ACP methyl ester carboxylesterase